MKKYAVTFRVLGQKSSTLNFWASNQKEATDGAINFMFRIGVLTEENLRMISFSEATEIKEEVFEIV